MKKQPPLLPDFPMNTDDGHIYNVLIEQAIGGVDLGYSNFLIELHSNISHDGTKVDGVTMFDERKIKLEMSLSDETARETLLHEIIHCILEGLGFDERHFDSEFIKLTNEQLTTALSLQLILVNRLNPKLFSVLFL